MARRPEPDQERVALPKPEETAARHPFPVLASVAPVVAAVVIWAITASPFALVFAALGPVVAVAGAADARLHNRRRSRRERARLAEETRVTADLIAAAHTRELARIGYLAPAAATLVTAPVRDPERWRRSLASGAPVRLGSGAWPSTLQLDGDAAGFDSLVDQARTLTAAPILSDARLGIGVCGPEPLVTAVLRGFAVQLAAALAPETTRWTGPDAGWMSCLPHRGSTGTGAGIRWTEGELECLVAGGRDAAALPHECRVVIRLEAGGVATLVAHPELAVPLPLRVELLSLEQATAFAHRLSEAAVGRGAAGPALPARVRLSELARSGESGLTAAFSLGSAGPLDIDLVADGPHAVVGGTTGSGKSELLLAWLVGIAGSFGPDEVTFLLVDFKGGASFGPIIDLPHVVGLVTDLDERVAHRALASLRAEVRFRERTLAVAGARSLDDLVGASRFPRLVIVVDEFAALVGGFTDLHDLFADLAARGRSLGIHLVLCTQRPAGVVRDAVLANVPLRLSLRVNNRADSTAVIGTDAAALLPADPPGRALVAFAGGDPVEVQVAIAEADDIAAVTEKWRSAAPPRRPWCDDLPAHLPLESLGAAPGIRFGLLDLPAEQRQEVAAWVPREHGNLLVLGAARSGKSVFLDVLARSGATRVPPGFAAAWDAVATGVESLRRGEATPRTLLIDDVDAVVARLDDEHGHAFLDLLSELLRSGGPSGVSVVITARRITASLQPLAAASDARLVLRMQDRQELLVAGGDPALAVRDAPAGRGQWQGSAVQVAWTEPVAVQPGASPAAFVPQPGTTIVVSGRAAAVAERFAAAAEVIDLGAAPTGDLGISDRFRPVLVVGDQEAWHARWSLLLGMRATVPILFDRCSLSDLRALSGVRALPPPIDQAAGEAWLLPPGGPFERVSLA